MSAVTSPSDLKIRHQRAQGRAAISFKRRGPATVLDRLHQQGCAKIRLPKVHNLSCPEAVLLNTSGGLTGGDHFDFSASFGPNTVATITTQAAERVYKASADKARVSNQLTIREGATAHWLPQETILFEEAAIERKFEVDLASDARLIAIESWMIGRTAMGEQVRNAHVRDCWRIRQAGQLIFADTLRLDGDIQALIERPAIARGQACFATLLIVNPDATTVRDHLRSHTPCSAIGPVVVARLFAANAADLRKNLARIIMALECHLPRVWNC